MFGNLQTQVGGTQARQVAAAQPRGVEVLNHRLHTLQPALRRRLGGVPGAAAPPRSWTIAAQVRDPARAGRTIGELGILRDVTEDDQRRVHVRLAPSYQGCPLEAIRGALIEVLCGAGYRSVDVEFVPARR